MNARIWMGSKGAGTGAVLGAALIALTLGLSGCDKRVPQSPAPSVSEAVPAASVATPVAAVEPATSDSPQGVGQPVPLVAGHDDNRAVPPPPRGRAPAAPPLPPARQVADAQLPAPQAVPATRAAVPPPVARSVAPSGEVVAIEPIRERPSGSGAGAVLGGVLGAVVGNQFGHGHGRTAMTVLGGAGGALAGNHVERNLNERVVGYHVRVRMGNGAERTYEQANLDGLRVGDEVRVDRGRLRRVCAASEPRLSRV